ncbi:hypothetical protein C7N43_37040, partial [Sphingobacteriales bacterium UPWRP_1]
MCAFICQEFSKFHGIFEVALLKCTINAITALPFNKFVNELSKMRKYLICLLLTFFCLEAFSQTYNMSNNSITNVSGTLYDSGGPGGNYANNQNLTFTICPTGGASCILLNFTQFATFNANDYLRIYSGNSTAAPLVGTWSGNGSPGTLSVTSSCVTINFVSNANNTAAGFTMTWSVPANCPLDVQTGGNNSNAAWLVQNVFLSGCTQISNVTFNGNSNAIGYFTNGSGIGIQEGIVISSGNVTDAEGPNNNTQETTNFGTPGDANLTALTASTPCGSSAPTYDAAVIQFNFVPLDNTVQFQYVFASEEYPEWVCSQYNDVFGFFISGPGVPLQNIAIVPGTTTYVGINTVNDINNTAYYVSNPAGGNVTQFDGYTTLLTAIATGLTPCQTYTIKLAVADAGDEILDSAVFLAANSFNAGNPLVVSSFVPSTGTQDAYEGCQDGYFLFTRGDVTDLSMPITFNITITGTATPGADYQPLVTTVTIPAGQISTTLPVYAYTDAIVEGYESIIVQINELQCNCTYPPPAQLNIYDTPQPFTAFTSNPPTICPGSQALIAVIAAGSTFTPYTYTWSNGSTGPAIFVSPSTTTTYTVTVTDACGRTTGTSIPVTVSTAPPNATINPAGPFCSNSPPVYLSAPSGGGTWSGPGVNPTTGLFNPATAAASGPGPYTITYSISNSCGSASGTTQIAVTPAGVPVINPVTPPCAGSSAIITLTANLTGGTWSGPGIVGGTNTTGQFNPALAAGTGSGPYTVTYTTPAPCGGSDTEVISVAPAPAAGAGSPQTICNGQSATLTATGGGTYLWSTGATTAAITVNPTATTTYTVTVTGTNGCTATATTSVTVNPPPAANAGAPQTICSGSSLSITATGGGTYIWSTGATTATITVNPVATTTYTVTVTNASGCTATASKVVTVNPLPVANAGSPQTICNGQSATLTATGGGTYLWSTGATTAAITVNPTATTTYTVTVTGTNGCTATATTSVTVNPLPAANAGAPQTICSGSSLSITATGGGTYIWSTGATTATITVNPVATTTYTVTVTNASGCTATASKVVTVNPTPTAGAGTPQTICNGQSATLTATGGGTYLWSTGATTATITVNPTATTTYTVTVTAANGCSSTANTSVNVNALPTAGAGSPQTICNGQ